MASHRPVKGKVRRWGKTDLILIKSVLASILLHVLILALLYQHIWLPTDDESRPVSLPDTEITLVRTNPQRHSVQPVQEVDEPFPAPAADNPPDCDDGDSAEYTAASEERENIRQLFTDMHPDLYYSPYKRRFELANAALQPLTERDDLVGALARNRHDLNEANLRYLNHQFTGDNPDMMTMRICPSMPCVFRFSEFEVKKPEAWEEASENQSRFQVTAPLFLAQ